LFKYLKVQRLSAMELSVCFCYILYALTAWAGFLTSDLIADVVYLTIKCYSVYLT